MTKKEKAKLILNILAKQYPDTPIPLDHVDNFTLLIAVLLSAQCKDERVNKITPILFAQADTPLKMSKLTQKQIYNIIKPCGLGPQKSKAIKALSTILVKEYNGEVPEDIELLEKLPGVGHKTASVVMSQGFGHPAFPVDTHIHRLAQRWSLLMVKMLRRLKKTLNVSSQKSHGTNFTYRSSSGERILPSPSMLCS